jgi:uncharacterized protein YegP (UPF0339 family)
MDFGKLWDRIVDFFNTGYNLYYVIGGAVLLLLIVVIACVAAGRKGKKYKAEEEVVAAVEPPVKKAEAPEAETAAATVTVDKAPDAPAKPVTQYDGGTKLAIMTPAPQPKKPEPPKEEAPPAAPPVSPEKEENEKIEESLKRPGVIQIYKDTSDRFRFRIKASNSFIVGHSQGYTTKYACKNGIKAIANMVDAEVVDTTKLDYKPVIGRAVFEIYRDNENKFRFRIRAANTNNILASQGYTTKENCINGIKSVKHIILNHTLQDLTLANPKDEE